MKNNSLKIIYTTVSIDKEAAHLIAKICKRYSLKKSEVVKLAFRYLEKANINPADTPESVKSELSKINKRQDDLIRFIRHYEEETLNPMIRVNNSVATKFENIVKSMEDIILSHLETHQTRHNSLIQNLSERFTGHADAINNQAKLISTVQKAQQRDTQKLLQLIRLYSELATTGLMDGKRKENLKVEILNLINNQ